MGRATMVAVLLVAVVVASGIGTGMGVSTRDATGGVQDSPEFPPGVDETGVTNASALLDAHRTAIRETGYAFVATRLTRIEHGGFTLETVERERGVVARGLSSYRLETRSTTRLNGRSLTTEAVFWANETLIYARSTGDEGPARPVNRSGRLAAQLDELVTKTDLFGTVIETGVFRVTGTETRDGVTFTTLVDPGLEPGPADDLRLVVDEDGRIRALSFDIPLEDSASDGSALRYEFELTRVGNVTVERPPWAGSSVTVERRFPHP